MKVHFFNIKRMKAYYKRNFYDQLLNALTKSKKIDVCNSVNQADIILTTADNLVKLRNIKKKIIVYSNQDNLYCGCSLWNSNQVSLMFDHLINLNNTDEKYLLKIRPILNISNIYKNTFVHNAKQLKDRKISGYYSLEDDITNAGAIYTDLPAVVDKNIVTTAHYKDMGHWMRTAISLLK